MNKKYIILSIGLLVILAVGSFAQEQPTPFAPILIQGNPNVGRIQPFVMSDVAIRSGITAWQQNGWTGQGIRVGVLDRGFGNLFSFEAAFNLTVTTYIGAEKAAYNANPVFHGTQVLETIHAVAPGAELYACEYNNLDSFVLCIDWMIASQVNIINHSAGVPALPLDGSSHWARQVERAANANILWVNAAGNFAQGYYTDVLTDRNVNRLHEFRGFAGEVEALGVAPIETTSHGVVMLSWEDYNGLPANAINLDLQVVDAESGRIIASSYNEQRGFPGDEAIEYLSFPMNRPFAVQIIDFAGNAAGVRFALFVEFASLPNGEAQGSIITPGDSSSALTVGALQGVNIAPYSSRGPTETGAIKPDLAAPGEVQLSNGSVFVGTSAAAPVVAGSAALIWEANPAYTARDVRTFILNATQDDDQFFGMDTNYGNGRLYLPLPVIPPTLTATESPTDTPNPTATPRPTNTPRPTATATQRPSTTPRPTATSTRRPTNTPRPTATPTRRPSSTSVSVSNDATVTITVSSANLRSGPGTNYTVAGTASSGQTFTVIARYEDWYLIDRGSQSDAWVWNGIVSLSGNLSQIEIAATIPPTPQVIGSTSNTGSSQTSSTGGNGTVVGSSPVSFAGRDDVAQYLFTLTAPRTVSISIYFDPPMSNNCAIFWYVYREPYEVYGNRPFAEWNVFYHELYSGNTDAVTVSLDSGDYSVSFARPERPGCNINEIDYTIVIQ